MMVENIVELPDFTVSTVEIHTIEGDFFALPSDMSPRHRGSRSGSRHSEFVAFNDDVAAFSAIEAQFGKRYKDTLVEEVSPYTDIQFPALFEDELNVFGVEVVDMPPSPSFKSGSEEESSSSETAKHRSQSKKNRNLPVKGKRRRQPQMIEIVDVHPILLAGEEVEIELSEHRRTPKRPVSPQSLSRSHNANNLLPYAPPSTPQPHSSHTQSQPMTPSTPTSSTHPYTLAPTPRRPGKTPGSATKAKERKDKRSAAAASPSHGTSSNINEITLPEKSASVDIQTLSFQGEEVLRISQVNTEESVEVDVGDDFDC